MNKAEVELGEGGEAGRGEERVTAAADESTDSDSGPTAGVAGVCSEGIMGCAMREGVGDERMDERVCVDVEFVSVAGTERSRVGLRVAGRAWLMFVAGWCEAECGGVLLAEVLRETEVDPDARRERDFARKERDLTRVEARLFCVEPRVGVVEGGSKAGRSGSGAMWSCASCGRRISENEGGGFY